MQSSAIKGIDWLNNNILLSLSFNWDEAFFKETAPLWSMYGLHRITVPLLFSLDFWFIKQQMYRIYTSYLPNRMIFLLYTGTSASRGKRNIVQLFTTYILTLKYSYHSFWFGLDWIYMVVASAAEPHILDLVFLCCDDVEKRRSNHRQSPD